MSNWLWVLLLAVAAYLGGVGTGWPLLQHVAYALLGIEVLALVIVHLGQRGLSASRTVDRSVIKAGDDVLETVQIEKDSVWPALRIVVDDGSEDAPTLSIWGSAPRRVFRKHRPGRRGRFELSESEILVQDPFGLFSLPARRLSSIAVTAYPRPIEVPHFAQARRSAAASQHRWQPVEADATMGDLRPYVPGDPPSRIHWRSTARTGTLMVSQPETPRSRATWLLVDLSGGDETAERAAGMAVYLVDRLLAANREVGAIIAGLDTQVIPSGRGWEHIDRLLLPLATVRSCTAPQIDRIALMGARTSNVGAFILLSPSPAEDLALRRLRRLAEVMTFVVATGDD